jgi:hypothetical protein
MTFQEFLFAFPRSRRPSPLLPTPPSICWRRSVNVFQQVSIINLFLKNIFDDQVMNETLSTSSEQDFISAKMASKFWNRCFATPLGEFCFDALGERQIELEIVQLNWTSGAVDRVRCTPFELQRVVSQSFADFFSKSFSKTNLHTR